MTSQDTTKEFHRGRQITFHMPLTTEQHAAITEWSAIVPTMHLLDICAVNATKLSDAALEADARKSAFVANLRDLDKPQHSFSYLCALMEKVSDSRGTASDSELEAQVLGDLAALRAFFKNARVYEPDDFVIDYLRSLRRVAPEIAQPNYLKFLETINNRFTLRDPVSPTLRFQKAREILSVSDALSIGAQHPVVLLSLACLYGNPAAKSLMKFKANPQMFNAENALADIMAIVRVAELKLQIEYQGRQGVDYARTEFITDDEGLKNVLECFEPIRVKFEEKGDTCEVQFDFRVRLEQLLTDLPSRQVRPGQTEQSPSEYDELLKLLG